MDGNNGVPFVLCHVEHHAVAQDSGGRYDDVELAVVVERGLDDVLSTLHRGDGIVVGNGLAAGVLYLVNDLVSGRVGHPGAVNCAAAVVHDDLRAFSGEQLGYAATYASPGAGNDGNFVFKHISHKSGLPYGYEDGNLISI